MLNINVVTTFFAAIVSAMFGYLKNKPDEDFQPSKITSTLLAAVFVAFLSVYWTVEPITAEDIWMVFFMQTGAITYMERILKAIWRNWLKET